MGTTRRTRGSGATIVDSTLSSGGEAHTSPLWLLATAGACGFVWFIFSVLQITGTEQAVFGFLQSTITITPQMTATQLLALQSASTDSDHMIAYAIGWAVQVFLLLASFPSEHYTASHLARGRRWVMMILLGADWLTDAIYVLRGRTVFDGFLHFAPGGFGVMLIAVIYPLAVTGITIFCGIELAHRVDRLIGRIRHA